MAGTGRDQYIEVAETIPFDNDSNDFVAEDVQGAIEELAENLDRSASPGFSFGRSGNVSSNSWLLRPGGVPSNRTGVTFGLYNGILDEISVGTENLETYTIEIIQHDGNEINSVSIASVSIVNLRKAVFSVGVDYTQTNPLVRNKQIAVKITSGSAKNIGVDLQLSGTNTP